MMSHVAVFTLIFLIISSAIVLIALVCRIIEDSHFDDQ